MLRSRLNKRALELGHIYAVRIHLSFQTEGPQFNVAGSTFAIDIISEIDEVLNRWDTIRSPQRYVAKALKNMFSDINGSLVFDGRKDDT